VALLVTMQERVVGVLENSRCLDELDIIFNMFVVLLRTQCHAFDIRNIKCGER